MLYHFRLLTFLKKRLIDGVILNQKGIDYQCFMIHIDGVILNHPVNMKINILILRINRKYLIMSLL